MKKGVVFGVVLLFSIMLSSAAGLTNVCLRDGETIYFSKCNPDMNNYVCAQTSCQMCVNEISSGVYCPASANSCENACLFIYSADQNSTVALVIPESDAKLPPGDVKFTFQTSLPNTLDRCDLYVNDVRKRYTSTPKVTNDFTVRSMDAGTYTWRIECKEKANYGGDILNSPSRILYIEEGAGDENATPNIALTSPANSASFAGGAQQISFAFTISSTVLSKINECSLYLDSAVASTINAISAENQISYDVPVGQHNWKVSCNNGTYTSETRSLTINAPATAGGGGGGYNRTGCQYKDYIEGNKSLSNLYINGTKQENILEVRNYAHYNNGVSGWAQFEVFNNLDYPVNVRVEFLEIFAIGAGSWSRTGVEIIEISPHNFSLVYKTYPAIITFDMSSIEFKYESNNSTEARWEKELIAVCRQCAGQDCLNDGDACDYSFQCGGGYCIESTCLNANDTLNLPLSFASNVSSLESWKLTIESWKLTITTALADLWSAINNQTARITALENRKPIDNITIINNTINNTLIINNTYILNNTFPNYFKYLSSSERKKLVCGYAEEKHLNNLVDLGWNCTITYRQYRSGERAACKCEGI